MSCQHKTLPFKKTPCSYKRLEFCRCTSQVLFSERDKSLVLHERFCNFVGKEDTNYALDMNVEFSNRIFKTTLHVYKGEPTTEILESVAGPRHYYPSFK